MDQARLSCRVQDTVRRHLTLSDDRGYKGRREICHPRKLVRHPHDPNGLRSTLGIPLRETAIGNYMGQC